MQKYAFYSKNALTKIATLVLKLNESLFDIQQNRVCLKN